VSVLKEHSENVQSLVPVIGPARMFNILRQLDQCKSIDELRDCLLDCIKPYGFKGFTLAIDRKVKSLYVHTAVMIGWPLEANKSYIANNLFSVDPITLLWQKTTDTFVWDLSIYDQSRKDHAQIVALRRELGVHGGICIPVQEYMGGRSTLFLSGAGFPSCPDTLVELRVITQHLVTRIYSLRCTNSPLTESKVMFERESSLSAREKQVLGWIAFGKSSREVGMIMGISEHTVNDHIASTVTKLDASNRTDAVLRALLLDEIDLK
jgi:LuxR family transcriptional regulator, quorum-sensing system regulator BjaR1